VTRCPLSAAGCHAMKFCVLTFGCRTNQADSFEFERHLRAEGGEPSGPETADLVVVNTCTVTAAADQAARNAIRRVARLNPAARIVATGCYTTRSPEEIAQLPGVVRLVSNEDKRDARRHVASLRSITETTGRPGTTDGVGSALAGPGSRGRTAFPLRVQTGCDERCAYCIVPSTRGAAASRPLPAVIDELRMATAAGFKELWLTGVHLGSYGRDLRPATSLADLLVALARAAEGTDVTFRMSSLEPMDCGGDVLDALASSPRFVPHVHLPLQHASDRVLAAMRRPYTLARYQAAVDAVRLRFPDAAIGADLIAGFPGECDDDVARQVEYLRGSPLTHVHVFAYSDRPGTEAARLAGKVPIEEIRRRAASLRETAAALNATFVSRHVGRERPALTLSDGTVALTDNYIRARIPPGRRRNERVRVRIASAQPVTGEVVA
jgi:threonylcarbamoyladenosine tRNA methylthiotransferase MtaB